MIEKSKNDSTWASSGVRPSTRARSSRVSDDTGGLQQRVHAVEYLGTAVQTRQLANGGLDGIGLGACRHAGIEAHKVVGMHAAPGPRRPARDPRTPRAVP